MRKTGLRVLFFGLFILGLNLIGLIVNYFSSSEGCFLCKIEPSTSIDGMVVNQFMVLGYFTLLGCTLTLIGALLRYKYDKTN